MLCNLSNLQFLCLHQSLGGFRSVEVEEIAGLRKVESSKCHFYDVIDFNKCLQKSLEERQLSGTFMLGQLGGHVITYFILSTISKKHINKEVQLYNCNIGLRGDFLALPEGIQKLLIAKCHDARNLCNVQATGLKSLVICVWWYRLLALVIQIFPRYTWKTWNSSSLLVEELTCPLWQRRSFFTTIAI